METANIAKTRNGTIRVLDMIRTVSKRTPLHLSDRFLWGPHTDTPLAAEHFDDQGNSSGNLWAMTDHQGTVVDVLSDNTLLEGRRYDGYGNVLESAVAAGTVAASVWTLWGFTGRFADPAVSTPLLVGTTQVGTSDLQSNRARCIMRCSRPPFWPATRRTPESANRATSPRSKRYEKVRHHAICQICNQWAIQDLNL